MENGNNLVMVNVINVWKNNITIKKWLGLPNINND